jgi:uncharacterized protein YbjQ (UPF0145 family)
MIVTTTNLSEKYEIMDVVFAYGSSGEGFLKTANPMEAYPKVLEELKKNAKNKGADAIVGAKFDYRVAAGTGCSNGKQVFEVFAYGTAVKFK